MKKKQKKIYISESDKKYHSEFTKMLAIGIRNSMEDFHVKYLSDKQMAELNPIIRNSIYTTLLNLKKYQLGDENAIKTLNWNALIMPTYWEEPQEEVVEDYKWIHG